MIFSFSSKVKLSVVAKFSVWLLGILAVVSLNALNVNAYNVGVDGLDSTSDIIRVGAYETIVFGSVGSSGWNPSHYASGCPGGGNVVNVPYADDVEAAANGAFKVSSLKLVSPTGNKVSYVYGHDLQVSTTFFDDCGAGWESRQIATAFNTAPTLVAPSVLVASGSVKYMPTPWFFQNLSAFPVDIYITADFHLAADETVHWYGNSPPFVHLTGQSQNASWQVKNNSTVRNTAWYFTSSTYGFLTNGNPVAAGATANLVNPATGSATDVIFPNDSTLYGWTTDGLPPDGTVFTGGSSNGGNDSWIDKIKNLGSTVSGAIGDTSMALVDNVTKSFVTAFTYLFVPSETFLQTKQNELNTSYGAKKAWWDTMTTQFSGATAAISDDQWQGLPVHLGFIDQDVNLVDSDFFNNQLLPSIRAVMMAGFFFLTALLIYKDAHHLFRS